MKSGAIVYCSNTGYTKRYAEMLSQKLGIPAIPLSEAKKLLPKGSEVIFMSWLMAGMLKDYKKASGYFKIEAACGVCLGTTGSQIEGIRKNHKLTDTLPVFTLQGGMDREKLRGINKFMINMLVKMLEVKKDKSADEEAMLELIIKGGDYVSADHLTDILTWASK